MSKRVMKHAIQMPPLMVFQSKTYSRSLMSKLPRIQAQLLVSLVHQRNVAIVKTSRINQSKPLEQEISKMMTILRKMNMLSFTWMTLIMKQSSGSKMRAPMKSLRSILRLMLIFKSQLILASLTDSAIKLRRTLCQNQSLPSKKRLYRLQIVVMQTFGSRKVLG